MCTKHIYLPVLVQVLRGHMVLHNVDVDVTLESMQQTRTIRRDIFVRSDVFLSARCNCNRTSIIRSRVVDPAVVSDARRRLIGLRIVPPADALCIFAHRSRISSAVGPVNMMLLDELV